jgi:hypothetical protein
MKLNSKLIFLVSAMSTNAYAQYGSCDYNRQELNYIQCYGRSNINEVFVRNNTSLFGNANIINSRLNHLRVNGIANIERSLIIGNVEIYGPAKIKDSKFNSDAKFYSNKVILSNINIRQIFIYSNIDNPEVHLSNSSINKITFIGKEGTVYSDNINLNTILENGKIK